MAGGKSKLVRWCSGALGRHRSGGGGVSEICGTRSISNVAYRQVVECEVSRPWASSSPLGPLGFFREGGGIGVRKCGLFSTVADATDGGSGPGYGELGPGPNSSQEQPLAVDLGIGFPSEAHSPNSSQAQPLAAVDLGISFPSETPDAAGVSSESGVFAARADGGGAPKNWNNISASQFPQAPKPKLRSDRHLRARNNSTVAGMLKLLEECAGKENVEKILDDHVSVFMQSSAWPWLPLFDALQRGPKPHLALEVFNWKKDKFDGGHPKEYAKMISAAGKFNQLELATSLFREMEEKGVKRSPIACNALMSAYSRNERPDQALAIFEEMREAEDCKPTIVTYNTLISMFSKLNVSEMENYFNLCKSAAFVPDRVTFNSMMWGYMRSSEFDKMEDMYEQLKNSGCRPDPITFSALIMGFARAGAAEKMEGAFNHMQEDGFPISTMLGEVLTESYALDKKFEKMEKILKIVANTPGATCTSRMYGLAIETYAESGRVSDMEKTMNKMFTSKRLFTSAKTLESVLMAYGSRLDFDGLDKVLERIKLLGWTYQESTFHTLLSEYGNGRDFARMEKAFKEMEEAADVQPSEETYKILADAYHSAGDVEGVKKTADRMSAAGFKTREILDRPVERMWTDDEIFRGRSRQ